RSGRFDLIVLDVGLPEADGFEVCRQIRATDTVPVLFLTARDDEIDRVVGLELGADDYVSKPFSPRELVARVAAILKRTTRAPNTAFVRGVLQVDVEAHSVKVGPVAVQLTGREMAILAKLVAHPDQIHTRVALTDSVYGPGIIVSDRTLDSHLRNIRAKLRAAGCADAVETLHGVGVRLGPCASAA
ncbi:MAG: response regulator, partial [Pseudomonadota bacterium]